MYDILKSDFKLSDAKAREFALAIREEVQDDIKYENSDFKSELKEDFLKMEIKFEQVNTKIEQSKNETVKWMLGIFITLALMILGLYATILLKK